MRKLIAMVAVAAGLMLGSVANAAQVDIFLTQTSATDWDVTINNNGLVNVSAIQMRVQGLDVYVANAALPNISVPDSILGLNPLEDGWNTLIVASTGTAVSIVNGGVQGALLGVLSGPGPVAAEGSEIALEAATVFATGGGPILDYSINLVPTPTTPEPITMILLGVGLAALGLVRRSA